MRKLKKLLAVLVCAAMTLAIAPGLTVSAADAVPEGLEYRVYDDHIEITDYYGSAEELTIPAKIEGLPVTAIGYFVFYNCSLTSVTIPESVTSIDEWAFGECDNLTSITIPKGVTSIGRFAFSGCDGLTEFVVNSENSSYCAKDGVLFDKEVKTLIQYPIGNDRETYKIPSGVTSIGNSAFEECRLITSVTIPESVTSIGEDAFENCSSLTDVTILEGVTMSIGEYAFCYCYDLTNITIPEGVTSIGKRAFYDCHNLLSITIPESVTSIGDDAFKYCYGLTEFVVNSGNSSYCAKDGVLFDKDVKTLIQYPKGKTSKTYTIPSGVTSIGDGAFEICSFLINVTIPESVTSIGKDAFFYCSSLTEFVVNSRNSSYCAKDGVLFDKAVETLIQYPIGNDRKTYKIPSGVTSIGVGAFADCENLTGVTIPEGVTSIGEKAFLCCYSLTSIKIPSGVTSIGESAFANCESFTDVTIPKGVTSIDQYTFSGCKGLTSVTISEGVTSIGERAFSYCDSLTKLTIPEGVTSIWNGAFENCSGIKSVTIPASVTSISWRAFAGCDSLTDVYYGGSARRWANISIDEGNEPLTNANIHFGDTDPEEPIPEGLKYELYDGSYVITGYTGSASELVIPSMIEGKPVTTIGGNALMNCTSLKNVIIPDSVTDIYAEAFMNCTGLTSIKIPASVMSIGWGVFEGCYNLASIEVDADNEYYISLNGVLLNKEMTWLGAYPDGMANTSYRIPDGVTSISIAAFSGCPGLTSLIIPASVTSVAPVWFDDLTDIYYGGTAEQWQEIKISVEFPDDVNVHFNSAGPEEPIPEGLVYSVDEYGVTITDYTGSASELNIPSVIEGKPVNYIGVGAFTECTSLVSVNIPDSVTTIDDGAFSACANLRSLKIGSGVTSIGMYVFDGCDSLASIEVAPGNPSYTGNNGVLFNREMTSLVQYPRGNARTSYVIPDSVTSISARSMLWCTNLQSIYIPASVTSIGWQAIQFCESLTDVYYGGSRSQWGNIFIDDFNDSLESVAFHYSSDVPEPEIQKPEVGKKEADGGLSVAVEVDNVPVSAELLAVALGADGTVVDSAAVKGGEADLNGENIQTVKVFCWESLESMRPLCEAKEVEVTQ